MIDRVRPTTALATHEVVNQPDIPVRNPWDADPTLRRLVGENNALAGLSNPSGGQKYSIPPLRSRYHSPGSSSSSSTFKK